MQIIILSLIKCCVIGFVLVTLQEIDSRRNCLSVTKKQTEYLIWDFYQDFSERKTTIAILAEWRTICSSCASISKRQ